MTPETEQELADAVRGATGSMRIIGGGTRPIGAPIVGEVLSTAGLSGIVLHEPGALTLVAKVGTAISEVEAALAAENQRLAFEPMDHRALMGTDGVPTLGGVVAANVSGPRRVQAGACRDYLLGVRFVDGTGAVVKNGGRVMKNVTGYDLVKLMAGSYGTLGVLSEVAFKVLPRAEASACLTLQGLDDHQAVAALSAALGSPFEVTGAAHVSGAATSIRIEGFAQSVKYRAGQLRDVLAPWGATSVEFDPSAVDAVWADIRDVTVFADRPGDVWRISVKPSDGPEVAADIRAAHPEAAFLFDWGGGLVWALVPEGSDIRPLSAAGHATLIRAADATKQKVGVFHPEAAALAKISAGLRARFDPKGLFNPGMMG